MFVHSLAAYLVPLTSWVAYFDRNERNRNATTNIDCYCCGSPRIQFNRNVLCKMMVTPDSLISLNTGAISLSDNSSFNAISTKFHSKATKVDHNVLAFLLSTLPFSLSKKLINPTSCICWKTTFLQVGIHCEHVKICFEGENIQCRWDMVI